MTVLRIMAGGPERDIPLHDLNVKGRWIGVDRGVAVLEKLGIVPEAVFGDFDSPEGLAALKKLKNAKEKHIFQSEKNDTDLALCLRWSLEQDPAKIEIYGATGGRADHFLGNLALLEMAATYNVPVVIKDKFNEISLLKPGEWVVPKRSDDEYLSFVAITKTVERLDLEGVAYPLFQYVLHRDSTRCISNEIIEREAIVRFTSGLLLMIRSRDKELKV
ncbi:thiamine diphosphokinase [Bacillaceae bacterium SIJ1]|uniref:thiamine diphosphokinase n=1 Tax=Litoribacterium kuwaitense TaxID=1398745 RepID=UPI0013EBEB73|nr:thiamine diphosphokinase [Litoribacterium kuwaitense]NGP44166.1 thiamine diphosphokinase [Litoribacterium kuwaitense]